MTWSPNSFPLPRRAPAAPTPARTATAPFKRGIGYDGYAKSLYAQDWFDSSTERDLANVLEDAPEIALWVRLQIGDLPILWSTGQNYHPDFVARESDGTHWVIEVKGDRDMTTREVRDKRAAARRWANHVSADPAVNATWRYLLLSEADISSARGSWPALKAIDA